MAKGEIVPCAVVIDEQLPPSSVEMAKAIFKRARVDEGDRVVVSGERDSTRVVTTLGKDLERCQIAMGPHLAIFLGIDQGGEVKVRGSPRGGGNGGAVGRDVEDFSEVLAMPQDRLAPLMGDDLHHFRNLTVEQVLDHLVRHGNEFSGRYLVVGANPDGMVVPRGEACEDPSLDVKVWDPSEK